MKSIVLILFSILLISGSVISDVMECGPNQHYTTCGSACPLNCDNHSEGVACIDICVEGCQCNNGYVLKQPVAP